MRLKKEEIDALLSSIEDLIDIKVLIRKTTPEYQFEGNNKIKLMEHLQSIQNKLIPVFSDHLNLEINESIEEKVEEKIKSIQKWVHNGNFLLVSSNSAKKKLKNLNIDPRQIIVSGGPVFYEDYQKVNPQIPDNALEGIKKKCEYLLNDIKQKDWSDNDLIFLYEKDDLSDTLTLEKIDRISNLLGNERGVKTIEITSWDKFE
ncbi:MAG: DUF2100 domain-containing protein [Candidatus Lokiarchaeota archaeon]|nr:DUF2100 domain-containing protein [Candidatus Lokiarchaeota archaeon]MBD3198875.1 DUF2100 domain-containing protein [Candidatus Lokiarchaeota archaeon]